MNSTRPISAVEPLLRHAISVAVSHGYTLSRHVRQSATQCDLIGAVLIAQGSLGSIDHIKDAAARLLGITDLEVSAIAAGWDGDVFGAVAAGHVDWTTLGSRLAREYLGEGVVK